VIVGGMETSVKLRHASQIAELDCSDADLESVNESVGV